MTFYEQSKQAKESRVRQGAGEAGQMQGNRG